VPTIAGVQHGEKFNLYSRLGIASAVEAGAGNVASGGMDRPGLASARARRSRAADHGRLTFALCGDLCAAAMVKISTLLIYLDMVNRDSPRGKHG
jgi:hypothetical protein